MSHLLFVCTMLCTSNMLDCCCSLESVSCLVLYITDIVTVTVTAASMRECIHFYLLLFVIIRHRSSFLDGIHVSFVHCIT